MINYSASSKTLRKERCETCRYLMVGQQGWYECHRHQPRITISKECDDEAIKPITMWPIVNLSDWCGEYAPKKQGA